MNALDLGFGFLVKNLIYSRLETSGNLQFGLKKLTNFSFEKFLFNLISRLYSPCEGKDHLKPLNGKLLNLFELLALCSKIKSIVSMISEVPELSRKLREACRKDYPQVSSKSA